MTTSNANNWAVSHLARMAAIESRQGRKFLPQGTRVTIDTLSGLFIAGVATVDRDGWVVTGCRHDDETDRVLYAIEHIDTGCSTLVPGERLARVTA